MDYENNPEFKGKYTIIYGHRMNNNTMFNQLHNFKKEEYWEANSLFDIYSGWEKFTYQIYAVSEVTNVSEIYDLTFSKDENFEKFVEESKSKSIFDTRITPRQDDYVVTLFTCLVANDNYRFVVHGVKILEK